MEIPKVNGPDMHLLKLLVTACSLQLAAGSSQERSNYRTNPPSGDVKIFQLYSRFVNRINVTVMTVVFMVVYVV